MEYCVITIEREDEDIITTCKGFRTREDARRYISVLENIGLIQPILEKSFIINYFPTNYITRSYFEWYYELTNVKWIN